jgi:hypothetical protein
MTFDPKGAVVEAAVVEVTEREEVVDIGGAAIRPMLDVVCMGPLCGNGAAGEAAGAVAACGSGFSTRYIMQRGSPQQ